MNILIFKHNSKFLYDCFLTSVYIFIPFNTTLYYFNVVVRYVLIFNCYFRFED